MLSNMLTWDLARTRWANEINAFLVKAILGGNQINSIALTALQPKAINHLLGQMPRGYMIVDNTANSVVWRSAPSTTTTITLEASQNTTISIYVY